MTAQPWPVPGAVLRNCEKSGTNIPSNIRNHKAIIKFNLEALCRMGAKLRSSANMKHYIGVYLLSNTTIWWISQIKTNLMQHCAGFISAESLYMFRAQAPIIRSI